MDEADFDIAGCIARVRESDEQAARELMQWLYPLVFKLVRAHLPRRTSQEDVCQMIFIKVFANLAQYSGKVPIEHWVSRIAVNTCINGLQAERVRPEVRWADLNEDEANLLQSLAATSEELPPGNSLASREIVEKMLGELNAPDRLVINLLHLEGLSIKQVCRTTGWNAAVVKVRAFRARRKLRKIFEQLTMEGKL